MSRKRIDLQMTGKPEGRQVIWTAIRKLSAGAARGITVMEVEDITRIEPATIRTYMKSLTNAGILKMLPGERTNPKHRRYEKQRWMLVKDMGVEAPRVRTNGELVTQGSARDQMWRAMKMIGDFTYRDLAVHASTEECRVSETDAKDYCKHLLKASYLRVTRKHQKGKDASPAAYRLIRNTGPKAPMIQRIKQVFDPNLGEVVWRPAS